MSAYYNEIDPYCAQWLRNLIAANLIPIGDVDERSIVDVKGCDLEPYTQCHFFAGLGGWAYALRLAEWPDERAVWTGSCPCQPFSCVGKRGGEQDKRHLWPEFYRLIAECTPAIVLGEQVASGDGRVWLSGVRSDLEAVGYVVGAADLCAAGVGAPHIRQRLWWGGSRLEQPSIDRWIERRTESGGRGAVSRCGVGGLADRECARLEERPSVRANDGAECPTAERGGDVGGLAFAGHERGPGPLRHAAEGDGSAFARPCPSIERSSELCNGRMEHADSPGYNGRLASGREQSLRDECIKAGFWSGFDTIHCLDGKSRRIEPGSFPLAHGVPARMGKLRAYGNAIVPQVAAEFVRAFVETVE